MLLATAIIFAVALLAATHYATFAVAHRKGYDKASTEEVSLMADDLAEYSNLLVRVLNSVEDLLTIIDGMYKEHSDSVQSWDDDMFEDWDWHDDIPTTTQQRS